MYDACVCVCLYLLGISKPSSQDDKDEDVESGNGPSLAQSPVSDVEISSARPVSPDESGYTIEKLVPPPLIAL